MKTVTKGGAGPVSQANPAPHSTEPLPGTAVLSVPLGLPGVLTPVSYQPPGTLSFDEWSAIGGTLQRINRSVQWWVGDWLSYGERKWGEMYAQAIEETGYGYQALRDIAFVSDKYELSRRRDNLSWSHHREVAALEPDVQDEWLDRAEAEGWSHKALRDAMKGVPHVSHNSGENEWYTPSEYIAAARAVLGTIELDPATSERANEVIQAEQIYTLDDDGLAQRWEGRVWMNPPYAAELIGRFTAKLGEHFVAGDVPEAIVLVNNATETQWFQELAAHATAICFPERRIRFWSPDGEPGAPLQGQAFLYLGLDPEPFIAEFKRFGLAVEVRHG